MSSTVTSIELQNFDTLNQASVLERGEHRNMESDTSTGADPAIGKDVSGQEDDEASPGPQPGSMKRTSTFYDRLWKKAAKGNAIADAAIDVLADLKLKQQYIDEEPIPGYPQLAQFIGSDERSMIFRQFTKLQARLILEKQDEMREIEDELYFYDRDDFLKLGAPGDDPLKPDRLSRRLRVDPEEQKRRQEMMELAERKFKEYATLLEAARSMASYERPASYEIKNVLRFVLGTKPVRPVECNWILEQRDLVTLRAARQHAAIGFGTEWLLNKIRSRSAEFAARFKTQHTNDAPTAETLAKSQGQWIKENARSVQLASWFVAGLLLLCVPLFFVVPILALSRVGGNIGQSIGVLTAFALVFTLLLSLGTSARPHEVLSCSAAYLAVLVVFFGNVSPRANT
ncbi:hypothetical protein TI39_contig4268g00026 [Zymoseptoria brevis]|uniref:DUF6594 domain-containing protein n=1 Tax=Zymoseptoria brevis TaxID=1047168 RepID=A0A0F4G8I1_9PEZI|nr:hypothetical protein TI39_contig4268g00026 [Zymoseptoria brevis]